MTSGTATGRGPYAPRSPRGLLRRLGFKTIQRFVGVSILSLVFILILALWTVERKGHRRSVSRFRLHDLSASLTSPGVIKPILRDRPIRSCATHRVPTSSSKRWYTRENASVGRTKGNTSARRSFSVGSSTASRYQFWGQGGPLSRTIFVLAGGGEDPWDPSPPRMRAAFTPLTAAGMRVLAFEDSVNIKAMLEQGGVSIGALGEFEQRWVTSDALSVIIKFKPDILLLDYNIPPDSGSKVLLEVLDHVSKGVLERPRFIVGMSSMLSCNKDMISRGADLAFVKGDLNRWTIWPRG